MVTKTRNPDRTKRAILDAAVAEFSAVGAAGARIDSIAAAAGVNKRMLYHYFESKEGLLAAVLRSSWRFRSRSRDRWSNNTTMPRPVPSGSGC